MAQGDAAGFAQRRIDSIAVDAVVRAIKQRHASVANFLPSLIGHRVQKIESDAIVSIVLRLAGKGVVALPVHDSIIVRSDRVNIAREVMEECLKATAGVSALLCVAVG